MQYVYYAIFDNGENICPDEDFVAPICTTLEGICDHVLEIYEEEALSEWGDKEDYYLKELFKKRNFTKLLEEFEKRDTYIHKTELYK